MLKYLGCLCILAIAFSCNSSENRASIVDGTKTYKVFKSSEMSTLMKAMYDYNMQLKADIIDGNTPDKFPREFLNIHTAELSDTKLRNATFEDFSGQFIEAQQQVFIEDSVLSTSERFNKAINLCLSCHQTACTGPIPKIKKLLIK